MISARSLSLLAIASGAAVGVTLVACSDDDDHSHTFSAEDAGSDATFPEDASGGDAPSDDAGALDAGPQFDASAEPVVCAQTRCAVQLVAGDNHFCALLSDGTVRCWGTAMNGARGGGVTGAPPAKVDGIADATQISASRSTTCVRTSQGRVRCWGSNDFGQLGSASSPAALDIDAHPTPSDVALAADILVSRVDVAPFNVCASTAGAGTYCWGENDDYQLARRDAGATEGPGPLDPIDTAPGFADIARVAGGVYHAMTLPKQRDSESIFGVTADHALVGWGLVSGRTTSVRATVVPSKIPSLEGVTDIAVGPSHACAIANGSVYCWGVVTSNALGTGVPVKATLPTLAPIVTDDPTVGPQQIAVHDAVSCVRMSNGSIRCCGDDTNGQLGRGAISNSPAPLFGEASAFTEHAVQVAVSKLATCALTQGGAVHCWGGNASGELGQGKKDTDPHPSPVKVTLP